MKNRKHFTPLFFLLFFQFTTAQQGNFNATFTATTGITKPVTLSVTKPIFKFEDPHGYWFINPDNGYKHFNIKPDQGYADRKEESSGVAFISFNQTDNDIDFYDLNDSISISLQKNKSVINPPKYDPKIGDENKPMHIHINSIAAVEISFTLSGSAVLISTEGYAEPIKGTINGTGHFYRQPTYAKSNVLPGCNCDPTIYAAVMNDDNDVRTASACEAAFNHKIFDAVQKSMANIFTNVSNSENVIITMKPGWIDINVPVKERPYCSSDFFHNGLIGLNAHKKLFSNDDRFGIRIIRTLSNEEMTFNETGHKPPPIDTGAFGTYSRGLLQRFLDKKITEEQFKKEGATYITNYLNAGNTGPDIKKLEAENTLYISIIINATNKTQTDLKLADKNNTVVTHNIKGAAFEIFSPIVKDNDGSWLNSKEGIYLGKFTTPVSRNNGPGFNIKSTSTTYPANANKLSVYNIIIKMEGGKDLMDKAIANIDFAALKDLINK